MLSAGHVVKGPRGNIFTLQELNPSQGDMKGSTFRTSFQQLKTTIASFVIIASTSFMAEGNLLYAYTIEMNPMMLKDYQDYLNSLKWDDGKRRTFSNLSGCRISHNGTIDRTHFCRYGYLKLSSPLGTKFCELQPYRGTSWAVFTIGYWKPVKQETYHGKPYPCK
jgi:hypothetical protein